MRRWDKWGAPAHAGVEMTSRNRHVVYDAVSMFHTDIRAKNGTADGELSDTVGHQLYSGTGVYGTGHVAMLSGRP